MDLKLNVSSELQAVTERLENAGYAAYFVGGCVRDMLLGKEPCDYDIATSATPERVAELFCDCKVIPTGIKHGTVTVIYKGFWVEITTFRKDGEYDDHRRPKAVVFSDSVKEDTARRDFTVNALCYSPREGLVDFYGGVSDLKEGILRCVGAPSERFEEDALRILRALRFASRLGFVIESETKRAMLLCRELMKYISSERILSELKGFFCTERSQFFVVEYYPVLASAIRIGRNVDVNVLEDVIKKTKPQYRLAVFFALCGGSVEGAVSLIRGLKPDNATLKAVTAAACACYTDCFSKGVSLAKALYKHGIENAEMMYSLFVAFNKPMGVDSLQRIELIKSKVLPLNVKELAVNGKDIMEYGAAYGKDIGMVMEHLFCYVHNGAANVKEVLLCEAVRYINERKNQ